MKVKSYVISFVIFSIVLGAILSLSLMNNEMYKALDLTIISYVGFSLLSFLTFMISGMIEKRRNRGALLQITFSNIMLKLIFTAVILYVYYEVKSPSTGLFVIPFIIVYIGFTIFEVYFINSQVKK